MSRPHVLVVDDSAVVRQAFSILLASQFSVDTAADPLIAQRKMAKRRPDVVVLDLQMPRMDGMTFLRQIMRDNPLPVVICSAAAAKGSDAAVRALEEGALDVIAKPQVGVRDFIAESSVLIGDALRAAVQSRRNVAPRPSAAGPPPRRRRHITSHDSGATSFAATAGFASDVTYTTPTTPLIVRRLPSIDIGVRISLSSVAPRIMEMGTAIWEMTPTVIASTQRSEKVISN
jgi:chemotaxis response regulator CheB